MKEKLELVESRSETLEGKLRLLKALKVTKNERSDKNTSMAKKVFITNENETEREEKIRQAQDQGSTSSTPVPSNSGSTPRTEKLKLCLSSHIETNPESQKPWIKVNYGN